MTDKRITERKREGNIYETINDENQIKTNQVSVGGHLILLQINTAELR